MKRLRRALLVLAILLLQPLAAGAGKDDKEVAKLAEKYRVWLEEVDALITKDERKAFLAIDQDYQRDAFIERFWQARDPYPDTARNELRERWDDRVLQARQLYGSLKEDRARMLLLNGPPAAMLQPRCSGVLWPLEIWFYDGSEKVRERFFLIFVQRGGLGAYRLWQPADGLHSLAQFASPASSEREVWSQIASGCPQSDVIIGALSRVLRQGQMGYAMFLASLERPPRGPQGEWIANFASYSTDLPAGVPTFAARLDVAYPARYQSRTVVQGVVAVPVAEVGQAQLGTHRSYDFVLTGEVLRGKKLFESFRYKFDFPAPDVGGETLPLVFERYLRPGTYRLVLKIEDLNGKKFYRDAREITVPSVTTETTTPPPADPETARILAEANAAIRSGENTIAIVPPPGDLQTGLVRFDTLTTGAAIADVAFALDGKPLLTKKAPPWSVELDLGHLPRSHTLKVTSYGEGARELASDELLLNAGTHRFNIRLLEPRRGKTYASSLRAEAEVEVPEDETMDRVELYLNEQLVATLYQPPLVQAMVLPANQSMAYVRAVAYLADGNSTEDVVFINAPEHLEQVEIEFVELYAAVVDRAGRPVEGLQREEFRVFEDGEEQEVARFERVENLPIHTAILLDISASMEENLPTAQQAALRFYEQALTPRDRGALVTFNDRPSLAVKLTKDPAALAAGLAGLKAERGTSLYDSLIFTLHYFNGVRGQRALLVLSDGKDETSRFSFEDALDYARRAGVAIYAIGLGFDRGERDTRKKLTRLADETGGRGFFIESAEELGAIYDTIQKELRSRYLVAYQSTNAAGGDKFRLVDLKVLRPGLDAKTIRGYYP